MKKIAVIDDDIYIGHMVEEILKKEGYSVLRAYSGTEAVYLLKEHRPDLILLDLMLPGLTGEQVLPLVQGIPVIVVSAKADVADKVKLLRDGAADYITKPFDTRELLARIDVQLRMAVSLGSIGSLTFGGLNLDLDSHSLSVNGQAVRLTRTEYAILKLLMQNPRQVLAKSLLLERISTDTPDCTESSLKIHVSNLRRKLRETGGRDYIESVWGIGYKMQEE
ncbi:MAG: response regulator transcription factor [Lachnospiraceae bacterium]|jgi:two-component system OmpR family response regulator|nr:response regulator transcription factor [Lachnospiraceae bacterium]